MFFQNPKLIKVIRHQLIKQWNIRTGYVYHQHSRGIVVSKDEALIQLRKYSLQDDLIKILVYEKTVPEYELSLLRIAMRYEFLGSLIYPVTKRKTEKFSEKVYVKELFQGFYESIDEVKEHVEWELREKASDEFVRKIFRKLTFIISQCCFLMAQKSEIWGEGKYRDVIEYAVENDTFDIPDVDNIWELYDFRLKRFGK